TRPERREPPFDEMPVPSTGRGCAGFAKLREWAPGPAVNESAQRLRFTQNNPRWWTKSAQGQDAWGAGVWRRKRGRVRSGVQQASVAAQSDADAWRRRLGE